MDCWIKFNDLFCCCFRCYTVWLKQDIEFSNAAHEYSNSLSREQSPEPKSPQSQDDNDIQPLSIKNETTNSPSTLRALKSPDEMPPELELHMRHRSSTYSTRSKNGSTRNLTINIKPKKGNKHKTQISRSKYDSKSNKHANNVHAVEFTRQFSNTSHAVLS